MGSRARRGQAVPGSAELSPVDLDGGEPRLVAGRCVACSTHVFPLRDHCPSCGCDVERELLPTRGTLWTWTTQGFEPKPPYVADGDGEFAPYGVGYVEFAGYLRVEGRLTEGDPEQLRIGMPMRVVAVTRGDRVTYAFAPE
jgi:uncharacterized OB-fold protein